MYMLVLRVYQKDINSMHILYIKDKKNPTLDKGFHWYDERTKHKVYFCPYSANKLVQFFQSLRAGFRA